MTQSRRSKVLLFSFLFSFLSLTLLATSGYSEESIFTGYYSGPFLQCKQTKKVGHGGCWVLKSGKDAASRCKVYGNAGGTHWLCKGPGSAVAKSKSK